MIGGIETPDKGSIIVNGFDVAKKGKKQKYFKEVVGFLFQNFAWKKCWHTIGMIR